MEARCVRGVVKCRQVVPELSNQKNCPLREHAVTTDTGVQPPIGVVKGGGKNVRRKGKRQCKKQNKNAGVRVCAQPQRAGEKGRWW